MLVLKSDSKKASKEALAADYKRFEDTFCVKFKKKLEKAISAADLISLLGDVKQITQIAKMGFAHWLKRVEDVRAEGRIDKEQYGELLRLASREIGYGIVARRAIVGFAKEKIKEEFLTSGVAPQKLCWLWSIGIPFQERLLNELIPYQYGDGTSEDLRWQDMTPGQRNKVITKNGLIDWSTVTEPRPALITHKTLGDKVVFNVQNATADAILAYLKTNGVKT